MVVGTLTSLFVFLELGIGREDGVGVWCVCVCVCVCDCVFCCFGIFLLFCWCLVGVMNLKGGAL